MKYTLLKESLSASKEIKAEELELTKLQTAFKKMCKDINYDIKNLKNLI